METWRAATSAATATTAAPAAGAASPHGAGSHRRRRCLGLSLRRPRMGSAATPEGKEGSSLSPFLQRHGQRQRLPFAPAFPGLGLEPTLVVARGAALPEPASLEQGAPDIFPLAASSPSAITRQQQPQHHSSSSSSSGGYDSDASTVVSEMGYADGAEVGGQGSSDEEDDDDEDGGPPPMPCAFGRTQRVYVERERGEDEMQEEEEEMEEEEVASQSSSPR